MEIVEKDIKELCKGDTIFVEMIFQEIYGQDIWARCEVTGNDWCPISFKLSKYRGVPASRSRVLKVGMKFRYKINDYIYQIFAIANEHVYYFYCPEPNVNFKQKSSSLLADSNIEWIENK